MTSSNDNLNHDNSDHDDEQPFISATETSSYRRHRRHQAKKDPQGKNNSHNNQNKSKKNKTTMDSKEQSEKKRTLPKFGYVDTHAVLPSCIMRTVLSLTHSTRIQNHVLQSGENEYQLELMVSKLGAIQGQYMIGDDTGSVQWNAITYPRFGGYFPLGSKICCTSDDNKSCITLQLEFKNLKENPTTVNQMLYRPVLNQIMMVNPMQLLPLESSKHKRTLLHCSAILLNPEFTKVLVGRKVHSDHFIECMEAIDYYFREHYKHRHTQLRQRYLCNKKAIETWSNSELELVAHYLPQFSNSNDESEEATVYRTAWKKNWMFDETLIYLSEVAQRELNTRREQSINRKHKCWSFPSATCACKIQEKRYKFEVNLETAKRAVCFETGLHIQLNSDCPFFDHHSDQTFENNLCFDRFFIVHMPSENAVQSISKRGYSHWKWLSIDDIISNEKFSSHLQSIAQTLTQHIHQSKSQTDIIA